MPPADLSGRGHKKYNQCSVFFSKVGQKLSQEVKIVGTNRKVLSQGTHWVIWKAYLLQFKRFGQGEASLDRQTDRVISICTQNFATHKKLTKISDNMLFGLLLGLRSGPKISVLRGSEGPVRVSILEFRISVRFVLYIALLKQLIMVEVGK